MSDIVIKAEHLSKMYKLGVINNDMLFRDIQSWWALKRGKEDPHSRIGEERYADGGKLFWALKDINFEIKQGSRVGIIGKNGAGKSTLLKVLSRITSPTKGCVKIKGKISSLLEVGTGFHEELTGRENIYLNGAVLGMKKKEIDRKLDEIIDFSGIEKHIDTPVKRYSSGMYVRLAFAVAAHLDSDILIADEVLAVGDAEFQKKALGKMNSLSESQGRTVLFVSHNIAAVKTLCTSGIILENGRLKFCSNYIDSAVKAYTSQELTVDSCIYVWKNSGNLTHNFLTINSIIITSRHNSAEPVSEIIQGKSYFLRFNFTIREKHSALTLFYIIYNELGFKIMQSDFSDSGKEASECFSEGENCVLAELPVKELMPGKYKIEVLSSIKNISSAIKEGAIEIPIEIKPDEKRTSMYGNRGTILYTKENWQVVK